MVADNFREIGTRLLTPLARNFPLDPMGISLLSLATAIGAGYCFSQAEAGSVWLLFAAGLVFLTALLDALDGIVARIRDLASKRATSSTTRSTVSPTSSSSAASRWGRWSMNAPDLQPSLACCCSPTWGRRRRPWEPAASTAGCWGAPTGWCC